MDVVEIVTQKVREAVNVMSTQFPALIKVKLAEKADVSVVPTKVSDLTNDFGYQNAQQVEDKIDAKMSGVYRASNSASTVAMLPALTKANVGRVCNMLNDFTTTADFVEGAGKTFSAGTNVVVTDSVSGGYKYDVLAGFVDLSGKQDKLAVTGAATKGIYVSAAGIVSPMTYELNANVPANFAPGTAAPLMDGTAAVGTSAKYAHEDHRHPVDTSRASAADLTALIDYIKSTDVSRVASGNPATFSDAKAASVKKLSVTLTPTQSGSGDPSPDNVRPVSGVDSVSVTRTGKNLFDILSVESNGLITQNGNGTLTVRNSSVSEYGVASPTTSPLKNYAPGLEAGKTYALTAEGTSNANYIYLRGSRTAWGFGTAKTLTQADLDNVIYFYAHNSNVGVSAVISSFQIEEGNAPTAYEPYQGQSVTVTLTDGSNPLTVYGGTLDVTTGTLAVTWANIASYNGETLPRSWMSDRDVYVAGTTPTTGAQVVYELAAPATYQLTPAQLATLAGYNAVFSDAGPVDVTYKADASIIWGGD